jgi:hypothetical protein
MKMQEEDEPGAFITKLEAKEEEEDSSIDEDDMAGIAYEVAL